MTHMDKWLRTAERVSLTAAGEAVYDELASALAPGWLAGGADRYYRDLRRCRLMVARVEQQARRSRVR